MSRVKNEKEVFEEMVDSCPYKAAAYDWSGSNPPSSAPVSGHHSDFEKVSNPTSSSAPPPSSHSGQASDVASSAQASDPASVANHVNIFFRHMSISRNNLQTVFFLIKGTEEINFEEISNLKGHVNFCKMLIKAREVAINDNAPVELEWRGYNTKVLPNRPPFQKKTLHDRLMVAMACVNSRTPDEEKVN